MYADSPLFMAAVTELRETVGVGRPAVERAVPVLLDHEHVYAGQTVEGRALHSCLCNWFGSSRDEHARHVAEQLATADLLAP